MMKSRTLSILIFAGLFVSGASSINAQNPLRAQVVNRPAPQQPAYAHEKKSVLNRILDNPTDSQPIAGSDTFHEQSRSGHRPPTQAFVPAEPVRHYDSHVVQAEYTRIPKADSQPLMQAEPLPNSRPLNFIEREQADQANEKTLTDSPQQDPHRLGKLISKLGMNLAFVLSIAIGFVLLAKSWLNPKTKQAAENSLDGLQVKETLVLDSKITLRLIQWRANRILVATDGEGIKSVNVLNQSFDQTLNELSQELEDKIPFETAPTASQIQRSNPYKSSQISQPSQNSKPAPQTQTTIASSNRSNVESENSIDDRLLEMLLKNAKRPMTQKDPAPSRNVA